MHPGSEVSVHYSSCFPAGLMGTGLWAEQTLSRQDTSSSSCFMHVCRLIPASFLVAYQRQQHFFLPESPLTAATNRFPSDTLSYTFYLISTCFVVSSCNLVSSRFLIFHVHFLFSPPFIYYGCKNFMWEQKNEPVQF